ncbi:MAG: hypothetical protein E7221_06150 [Clostridiales bacterium]|nr:hypothetical protein [Clostridiales bacterium]
MEKVWKRLIAVALSLMLMFTMGLNVFAAENVEGASNDDPAVTLDEGDAAATDVEPADEAVVQEEAPAEEAVVQEDEPEVAAMDTELADGTYNANGLSTAVLSMYHFENPQVVVKGDNAWLITTEELGNTVKRFDGMAYGKQSEILDATDETNRTLVEGTPTATVVPIYNEDGTLQTRTFVLPVPKSVLEAGGDIYYMIKYVEGYSDAHNGDWYKASGGDYYLTGYTLEKVSDDTTLPGEETSEKIDLTITNNTGMFKAVTAYLTSEGSQEYLVMALSGSGYAELFKGTFEQAVANGDGTEANGNNSWIHGYTNAEGKLEFKIPMEEDETYVPVVSVSNSYYNKYIAGTNSLERAFFPRQFTLDRDAKTLVTGDYEQTKTLDIINLVRMFKPGTTANVHVVGGQNSNNYSVQLTLNMESNSYSKVKTMKYNNYTGNISEAGEVEIELGEGNVFADIPVLPNKALKLQFYSAKNDKYYDRYLMIDLVNDTATFTDNEADAENAAKFADVKVAPIDAVTYNGEAWTPEITVTKDETPLVKDTDYTVEYADNTNAGTAKVFVKGAGEYKGGGKNVTFTINPAPIDETVVPTITATTYTGKAITPEVTVTAGDKTLVKDTDYTVAYANNINAGTAKITVKGEGNYAGEATATFTINPAAQKLTMSAAQKTVKFKKLKKKAQTTSKVAVTGAKTKVTYAKVGGSKKLSINKTTGKITVKKKTKKGTYKITVRATAAKTTNYKAATVTKTIKVKVKK